MCHSVHRVEVCLQGVVCLQHGLHPDPGRVCIREGGLVIPTRGCARFAEFLQNVSECQILSSLCSVVFHALTLKLAIQTLLFVAPELPISLSSLVKMSRFQENE